MRAQRSFRQAQRQEVAHPNHISIRFVGSQVLRQRHRWVVPRRRCCSGLTFVPTTIRANSRSVGYQSIHVRLDSCVSSSPPSTHSKPSTYRRVREEASWHIITTAFSGKNPRHSPCESQQIGTQLTLSQRWSLRCPESA